MANENDIDPNVVIDELGGTSEVARLCEINPASVSGWRENGIPKSRLMYLRLARPDAFRRLERPKADLKQSHPQI